MLHLIYKLSEIYKMVTCRGGLYLWCCWWLFAASCWHCLCTQDWFPAIWKTWPSGRLRGRISIFINTVTSCEWRTLEGYVGNNRLYHTMDRLDLQGVCHQTLPLFLVSSSNKEVLRHKNIHNKVSKSCMFDRTDGIGRNLIMYDNTESPGT
jgi:hypothetical protein